MGIKYIQMLIKGIRFIVPLYFQSHISMRQVCPSSLLFSLLQIPNQPSQLASNYSTQFDFRAAYVALSAYLIQP